MQFDRQSGVFHHLTALPGPHGIGDLGAGAHDFLAFLDRAEQSCWQFCPLGPTLSVHGHSPYQSPSAFAGNPLLVDLRDLAERGLLPEDIGTPADSSPHEVRYEAVAKFKRGRLRTAFETFEDEATDDQRSALAAFRERESSWLADYTLFRALKDEFDDQPWPDWPRPLRRRDTAAIAAERERLERECRYHAFCQWLFDEQWATLQRAADEHDIALVGDIPLYVALDSADVWASQDAFAIDDAGRPRAVAGVPPNPGDDGQRWGNPVYDWDTLAVDDYGWWRDRLRRLFDLVDIARIDHFKGFHEYWAIPDDADDPAAGEWREGPGADFFETIRAALGDLPFVVEDLGFLDPDLATLRDRFGFPGMRVVQYADWCTEGNRHQPMHYPRSAVGYTSTHDTDTVLGYYEGLSERQRDCLHYNIGSDGEEIHWDLIEAVFNSEAVLAMTTVPDLLGLGGEARFNTPGTTHGNWRWRVTADGLDDAVADRLAAVTMRTVR
jgi:4-alpha-glucanotransferase